MSTLSRAGMEAFAESLDQHSTGLAHLPTWKQEEARAASSELLEAWNHASDHGYKHTPQALSNLKNLFFAGRAKDGSRADEMGLANIPVVLRVEFLKWGERPIKRDPLAPAPSPVPLIMTEESATSNRTAVLEVTFVDTNEAGYGEWGTAEVNVLAICPSFEEAKIKAYRIHKALGILNRLGDFAADYAERMASLEAEPEAGWE